MDRDTARTTMYPVVGMPSSTANNNPEDFPNSGAGGKGYGQGRAGNATASSSTSSAGLLSASSSSHSADDVITEHLTVVLSVEDLHDQNVKIRSALRALALEKVGRQAGR